MSQIKVKNFGPIKSGFADNNEFMDIRKITVFIGNQGTGKSSIAKLISILSWLEKALYRGIVTEKEVTNYNRFINKYCNYQNLKNYFLSETKIEYRGNAYNFNFKEGKLSVINNNPEKYLVPKIMYVPAERNFFSAVRWPGKIQGLPESLYTFWQELETIVPEESCISEEDAIVYELTEAGEIKKLPTYKGLPSDENYLNISLEETNQLFDDLLEIEEQLCV